MIYLDKIDNLKVFSHRKIIYPYKSNNYKKDMIVYHLSDNNNEIEKLVNGNLFYKLYLQSYFIPFKFKSFRLKKNIVLDRKLIYNKLERNCSSLKKFRKTVALYKNLNLIYDLNYSFQNLMEENIFKDTKKVSLFVDWLQSQIKDNYKNKVVAINVPDNFDIKKLLVKNADDPFSLFFLAVKKKIILKKEFDNIIFLLYSSNSFTKFTLNNEKFKFSKFHSACNTLIKDSNNVETNEIENYNDRSSDDIIKEDVIVNRVMNYVKGIFKISKEQANSDFYKKKLSNISKNISERVKKSEINETDVSDEEKIKEILNNEENKADLEEIKEKRINSQVEEKRIEKLKNDQNNVMIENKTVDDILNEFNSVSIDTNTYSNKNIVNDEVKYSTTTDFDNSYQQKQLKKDLTSILTSFNNDPDIKMYLKDFKKENTSDLLNKKETISFKFKDDRNVIHQFSLDVPLLQDDKYFIINGGKKSLMKQLFSLPIIKIKPDTVQITTNYNKVFIRRFGRRLSDNTERLKKFFSTAIPSKKRDFTFKLGNSSVINSKYSISLEYSEISTLLLMIKDKNFRIEFDQKLIQETLNDQSSENFSQKFSKIKYDKEKYFPIGFSNSSLLLCDIHSNEVFLYNNKEKQKIFNSISYLIFEMIRTNLSEESYKSITSIKPSSSLTYTRAKMNGKQIPLIVILSYEKGLKYILDHYNIEYEFIEKTKVNNKIGKRRIKFKNGCLLYNSDIIRNTLLLDGLTMVSTEEYNFEDMNKKDPYIEYFYEAFGSRNIGKGIHNNLTLLVDPITLDVLKQLKLPTNIIDLILYANTMLEDSSYKKMNDMSTYRLRGTEQVVAIMYKLLADSFKTYKDTVNNGNPIKVSLPKDILIKKLLAEKTLDEYSVLNPSLEIEKAGNVTYKGPQGKNLSDSYTPEIRSYSSSMRGILSPTTPDSDKTGVVRQLSYNSKINSTRGFFDTDEKAVNDNTNLYSPVEMINPFTATHSDPPRMGMQSTQQKHVIPTTKQTKPLIGSGVEKTLPYLLGTDFVFVAKDDGIVEKIDKKKDLAIIKYKNGKKDLVDLSNVISKNSNGGFFINNQKEFLFKEGDKFKKQDILAKNPDYFVGDNTDDISYTTGALCKVALASSDQTYEDSSYVTNKLCEDFTSKIVMKKSINLGKGANVDFIVKKGQKIKTGEDLIKFEAEFEDDSLNDVLDKLGTDFKETINDLSKNSVKSKYTGIIKDIVIYYNRELSEYSPSLKAIIENYINENKARYKLEQTIQKENDDTFINVKPVKMIKANKIKGEDVDGVLIDFFVEYKDKLGVGDKLAYGTAIKSVIDNVLPDGEEPFSEDQPDERIDAVFSPLSIVSRLTFDEFFLLYCNKVLVYLKKRVKEIYFS